MMADRWDQSIWPGPGETQGRQTHAGGQCGVVRVGARPAAHLQAGECGTWLQAAQAGGTGS